MLKHSTNMEKVIYPFLGLGSSSTSGVMAEEHSQILQRKALHKYFIPILLQAHYICFTASQSNKPLNSPISLINDYLYIDVLLFKAPGEGRVVQHWLTNNGNIYRSLLMCARCHCKQMTHTDSCNSPVTLETSTMITPILGLSQVQ